MRGMLVTGDGDDEQAFDERVRRSSAPENELPALVPVTALLARTDTSALALTGVRVFSTGLEFTLDLRCLPEALPTGEFDLGGLLWRGRRGHGTELLVGVEFADGRRASNLAGRGHLMGTDDPEELVFHQGGGSGHQLSLEQQWWLSPLPPAGPVRLIVRCEALDLGEASVELDGAAIRAAAEEIVVLWPWVAPSALQPPAPAAPDVPADSWFAAP